MADAVPTSEDGAAAAMSDVPSDTVGDQGEGHQPSLVSEAEDAILHLQVAEETFHEQMEVTAEEPGVQGEGPQHGATGEGDGNLSEQVSFQPPEPTDEADASSTADSCEGTDGGESSSMSESEESDARSAEHQKRDGRARVRSGDGENRRRRAPSRKREPSLTEIQRFFADPYTKDVLYHGKYFGDKPADCVKFCAD